MHPPPALTEVTNACRSLPPTSRVRRSRSIRAVAAEMPAPLPALQAQRSITAAAGWELPRTAA